ncbi:MAG: hypothetical protein AAB930_02760 [Patescibacteria group bacterium]
MRIGILFGVLVVLVAAFGAEADERFTSSFGEEIWIKSSEPLPDFNAKDWLIIRERLHIASDAPMIKASYAIGHIRGQQLAFEVFIVFHGVNYLHKIVYYLDGRTPRMFIKRSANPPDSQGLFFGEVLPNGKWRPQEWPPDALFPNLKELRFTLLKIYLLKSLLSESR